MNRQTEQRWGATYAKPVAATLAEAIERDYRESFNGYREPIAARVPAIAFARSVRS